MRNFYKRIKSVPEIFVHVVGQTIKPPEARPHNVDYIIKVPTDKLKWDKAKTECTCEILGRNGQPIYSRTIFEELYGLQWAFTAEELKVSLGAKGAST